ncbi:uncharacterized protein LOC101452112 [Ceratitis capitata]|uniref:Gametocyte-specific factor 1 n=1 Tax=Ceratitis capitata TaxID=7213 RepID=W8BWC9_CERCA|nr:uncharacterized protein LOC101452112 [Ceratitis capitata]
MYSIEDDSDVVVCPYNSAHRLMRKRLQSHLIKCRQNYPQLELQICPFNVTHHIPEPEFNIHVTNCPDRKLITQYKYDIVEPKEEERVRHAPVECEENWDDTEVEDYNPQKFIDQKPVLRKPFGIPASERKQFIKRERIRLGDHEVYSDSDEEEEEEDKIKCESPVETVVKEDVDEELNSSINPLQPISPSPPPSPKRIRSRSRSPVSAYYRRIHGRESHSPSPPPPPRFNRQLSRERSPPNSKRARSPEVYEIDDDPYYNGGRGWSSRNVTNATTSSSSGRDANRSKYEAELYMRDTYANPPLVSYPTRMPSYGRGAHRGYSKDRRNDSHYNGRY